MADEVDISQVPSLVLLEADVSTTPVEVVVSQAPAVVLLERDVATAPIELRMSQVPSLILLEGESVTFNKTQCPVLVLCKDLERPKVRYVSINDGC